MHAPSHSDFSRRQLLRAGALALMSTARLAMAGTADASNARFVFVVLRGGMDGLYAVPALGDPAFVAARGPLANFASAPLPLDNGFALHPALAQMHAMFGRSELAVVHAVGLPYRERSHFDAQQLLEIGRAHV